MSEDLFDRSILQTRVRKRGSIDPDKEGFWPNTQDLIGRGRITPLISNHISTEFIFNGTFAESVVKKWSDSVNYPWGSRPYITSVAQYARIRSSPAAARSNYLSLLKEALFDKAYQDKTTRQLLIAYENKENNAYTFTQMARDLGYLDFQSEGLSCHPLALLARLPFKVYITTSYHQFLEVALEQRGKEPDSQIFPWQERSYVDAIKPPTEHRPLVFHLFGRDDQPESMVLTENDHLDLLAKFIRVSTITNRGDKTDNAGRRIEQGLPRVVRDALFRSNRLLLGYGIRSWDFRVLFRGLLTQQDGVGDSDTGLFIQFMDVPGRRRSDADASESEERERTIAEIFNSYLLNRSKLRVKWATPEKTMEQLYEIWEHGGLHDTSAAGENAHG